jgi:hypothetical protein
MYTGEYGSGTLYATASRTHQYNDLVASVTDPGNDSTPIPMIFSVAALRFNTRIPPRFTIRSMTPITRLPSQMEEGMTESIGIIG